MRLKFVIVPVIFRSFGVHNKQLFVSNYLGVNGFVLHEGHRKGCLALPVPLL